MFTMTLSAHGWAYFSAKSNTRMLAVEDLGARQFTWLPITRLVAFLGAFLGMFTD